MATNLEEIALHLDNHKIRYYKDVERSTLVFKMSYENHQTRHTLYVGDDGNTLLYKVYLMNDEQRYVRVPYNHDYVKKFMKFLLYSSTNMKLGSWEYDFNNEIFCLVVSLPLDNAILSKKQFSRLFDFQMYASKTEFIRVKALLETGKFPKVSQ